MPENTENTDQNPNNDIIDIVGVDVIDTSKEQEIVDTILKSLDVTKNTDIDKRDHTTIVGTDDKDYIIGSPEDDLICAKDGNDVEIKGCQPDLSGVLKSAKEVSAQYVADL